MKSEHSELAVGQARLGTWLRGKYRLDATLGIGGMAVVYAATHRNKKRFAVKVLRPEFSQRVDVRQRFLREGYVANTVEHPGSVAVLDDDVAEDGAAFLVMELLDGASADDLAHACRGRLGLRVVFCVAHQVLDVLAAAHAKNIIHRDIKPANVFVTRSREVKVLDFGIARIREAEEAGRSGTHTGMALGTPAFMSPEQALGRSAEIDAQSDVWSVGAMMFRLICALDVHEATTSQELLVFAATRIPRSLAEVMPDAPREAVQVVDRALAFSKADRFASAAEMRDAIREAYRAIFAEPMSSAPLAQLVPLMPAAVAGAKSSTSDVSGAPTVEATSHLGGGTPSARSHPAPTPPSAPVTAAGPTTVEPVASVPAPQAKRNVLVIALATVVVVTAASAMAVVGRLRAEPVSGPPSGLVTQGTNASTEGAPENAAPPSTGTVLAADTPDAAPPSVPRGTSSPHHRPGPLVPGTGAAAPPTPPKGASDFDRQ